MTNAEKVIPDTLKGAYPQGNQVQAPDTKELDAKKAELEKTLKQVEELKTQNKELTKKLEVLENERKVALAERVADVKVERGLLTKEKRKDEVDKLAKLSEETLKILHEELSQVNIKLSDPTPAPQSKPIDDQKPELSDAEKHDNEVKEMRMKLFGHDDDPYDYYMKQKQVI